jgi:hypothetical protein
MTERALLEALLSGRSTNDPGDLAFKLFLSKQVDYAKTVCVVDPTIPADADFEQRGIQPLLGQTESEFEDQVSTMENASNAKEGKAGFKAYLDAHLEDPGEYKAMIDSNDAEIARSRWIHLHQRTRAASSCLLDHKTQAQAQAQAKVASREDQ